jgi:hypothetical protein
LFRKTASGIMLFLLLTNVISLAFNIQSAKANDVLIGAYYYVWWDIDVNPHWPLGYKYTPILGEYNSGNPNVADQHILWATEHGVNFFAVSWFGSHLWADYPYVDKNLRDGLLKASRLPLIKFCIFYESATIMDRAESLGANKTQVFIEDMVYVATNYFNNPSYLKIAGRPVVFLYALYYLYQEFGFSVVPFNSVREQLAKMGISIYFVGDAVIPSTPDVNSPLLKSMDAVTSYYFKFATDWTVVLNEIQTYYPQWLSAMNSIGVGFIPNVYPGFDDTAFIYGSNRVLPRSQSMFRKMLDIAVNSLDPNLKVLIITSWNEWHESTSIEPSVEWGETYLEEVYSSPLSVSISPLSTSVLVGQSVTFTSTVSGGYTPYAYQWYLNDNPVSGATSTSWTFTPKTSGIYYIQLKVMDAQGNTAQSNVARVSVASVPVGGYSIPIQAPTKVELILLYIALVVTITTTFTTIKRKAARKTKQPL